MKIYMSFHQLPELKDVSRSDRKLIINRHRLRSYQHWQCWFITVVGIIIILAGFEIDSAARENLPKFTRFFIISPFILAGFYLQEIGRIIWARPYIKEELGFRK